MLAPACHGEQVSIGHREGVAHQIGLARQLAINPLQAGIEAGFGDGFGVFRHGGIEQGRKALVQFGADKAQPLLQFVALKRAVGRGQGFRRYLVSHVLQDDLTFAQLAPVVEYQQGHITERVDGVVVGAIGQLVRFGGGGNRLKRQARLLERNVGGQWMGFRGTGLEKEKG